jgi:hypothetical protein
MPAVICTIIALGVRPQTRLYYCTRSIRIASALKEVYKDRCKTFKRNIHTAGIGTAKPVLQCHTNTAGIWAAKPVLQCHTDTAGIWTAKPVLQCHADTTVSYRHCRCMKEYLHDYWDAEADCPGTTCISPHTSAYVSIRQHAA